MRLLSSPVLDAPFPARMLVICSWHSVKDRGVAGRPESALPSVVTLQPPVSRRARRPAVQWMPTAGRSQSTRRCSSLFETAGCDVRGSASLESSCPFVRADESEERRNGQHDGGITYGAWGRPQAPVTRSARTETPRPYSCLRRPSPAGRTRLSLCTVSSRSLCWDEGETDHSPPASGGLNEPIRPDEDSKGSLTP